MRAGGGPDLVDIGDLTASDVQSVDADLGLLDGARDEVAAQGSDLADVIRARPAGDVTLVTGLPGIASLRVENSRPADDRLTLLGRGGADNVDAFSALAPLIGLTVDGGAGGDSIVGTDGPDVLRGGPDADVVRGRKADDTVDLGDGDDVFLHQATGRQLTGSMAGPARTRAARAARTTTTPSRWARAERARGSSAPRPARSSSTARSRSWWTPRRAPTT